MFAIKTLALCLVAVLATTSTSVHAGTTTRNLRAQHDSDAPHTYGDANGATTTNINFTPGTVHTNVQITPGTSTTTVEGLPPAAPAPAPLPPAPMAAPPAPVAMAPRPAPAAPSGGGGLLGGLMGGGGSPFTGAATMAHKAHGALLGHTGTVPSSYMQGQQGGGHH